MYSLVSSKLIWHTIPVIAFPTPHFEVADMPLDHMKTVREKYVSLLQDELHVHGNIRGLLRAPLYSCVTSEVVTDSAVLAPEYWGNNLTSPVKFHSAISRLLQDQGPTIFLEIGPHSTLAGPLRQICAEARLPCTYIPTMLRLSNSAENLLTACGLLYQQGIDLNFKAFTSRRAVARDLPAYPWDHSQSFWYESRISRDWRFRPFGHHALLGQRVTESTSFDPSWRVLLDLEDEPWLIDHKVGEDIVFPIAEYISMAGEAIRQISGVEIGYSVRHVVAHTALVLTQTKSVEVATTLSRYKLTDSTDSESYTFTISSYSGTAWIKDCDGQVMPKEKDIPSSKNIEQLPRQVRVSRWYEIMARVGLVYGPEFQGITSFTTSATEQRAVGKITNTKARQDAPFLFHPATIDAGFQMILAALAQGAGRNFTQLCVPTLVEELDISRSSSTMIAEAWSSDDGKDVGLDCIADGKVALRLRGIRLSPLDDEGSFADADRHAAARLEWYPDFDFMEIPLLFTPPVSRNNIKQLLEELALLCLLDSHERLQGLHTKQPHFLRFRDWLARERERAGSGNYPIVQNASSYLALSHVQRVRGMEERMGVISITKGLGSLATGIMRICENAEGLFTGSVDTLDLLMKDNVLTEIYNAMSFGLGDFVHMLSVSK
jgi:acyl transferase domain-containing protein